MTAQEIFDTVWNFMHSQREQSMDPKRDTCCYRDPQGRKCAVGCLFSDDEYSPDMDDSEVGLRVSELFEMGLMPERLAPHRELLADLQSAHDFVQSDFLPSFKQRASRVAENHNLTAPEATK